MTTDPRAAQARQGRPKLPRAVVQVLGWCLALALIGAALWYVRGQLPAIREVARSVHPRWGLIAVATTIVLLTYALLIECWRFVLAELGAHLSRSDAMIVWFASSLARYLPLSGWQLAVMTLMAKRRNVPVTISAAASVVITVTNLLTGLLVFVVASATRPALRGARVWMVLGASIVLLLAPIIVPRLAVLLKSVMGRELVLPQISARAILGALVGTALAWIAYGVAFWVLTQSIFPDASRSVAGCIALYTGAYMAGLLALVPPAGLGAAEFALVALSEQLGLFGRPEASVLALVVRVWRTGLEVIPGVVALGATTLLGARRRGLSAQHDE